MASTLEIAAPQEREPWAVELVEMAGGGDRGYPAPTPPARGIAGLLDRAAAWIESHHARRADLALAEVIRLWACLPGPVREAALLVGRGRARSIVAVLARRSEPGSRLSAAAFMADARDPFLIPSATTLVADQENDVARLGERAFLAAAATALASSDPQARRVVELGLAHLIDVHGVHRRAPLFALAAELLDPRAIHAGSDPLSRWFLDQSHHGRMALRTAIRRSDGATTRLRAWEWLKVSDLAPAAAERLARSAAAPEHAAVLAVSHLGLNPARGRRARLVGSPGARARARTAPVTSLPHPAAVPGFDAPARRGLPRWLRITRAPDAAAGELLSPLIADPDPVVRLLAAVEPQADQGSDYCFDAEAPIARAAALRWLGAARAAPDASADDAGRARITEFLARSPHPDVARWARQDIDRRDPWHVSAWSNAAAARECLARAREPFLARLRERLREGSTASRLCAVMLARRLGLHEDVELELLALAHASRSPSAGQGIPDLADEKVSSAAVAALGESDTPTARDAVRACLDHPLDRARASAVEAAMRSVAGKGDPAKVDPRSYAAAVELKGDAHHRVRANALRGLLRAAVGGTGGYEPSAVEGLAEMLADSRPMHRLAGVWLAQRTLLSRPGASVRVRWSELASRVADLARSDADGAVRSRAVCCVRSLQASVRFGWESRAPELVGAGDPGEAR